jgi:MFS family permease
MVFSERVASLRKKLSSRRTRSAASAEKIRARRTPLRSLWWWLSLVVVAASGGFIPPAIVMAYSVTEGWDGFRQFGLLVFAGLLQGFALGIGEAIALRRGPLRVPAGRWILVTTLAMGAAWLVALLPGSFGEPDWSNPFVLVGVIVAILVVILIVPTAQWLLLRSRGRDAWRWIIIMSISTTLGVGSLLTGILLAEGKTSFIGTLLPFILTGWVGILLFTIVSGLGVYWMAREAYTAAETSAVLARRAANESRATTAAKAAAARVSKRVGAAASPALRKVASRVTTAAKKAGSQTAVATKKTATRVKSHGAAASAQEKPRAKKSSGQ